MRNTLLIAVVLVFTCFLIVSCAKAKPDLQYYEDYWTVFFKFKKAIMVARYDHRGLSDDIHQEMEDFLEKEKQYSHLWSYWGFNQLNQWSRGNFVGAAVSDVDADHARYFYIGAFGALEDGLPEKEMEGYGIELDLSEIEKRVFSSGVKVIILER